MKRTAFDRRSLLAASLTLPSLWLPASARGQSPVEALRFAPDTGQATGAERSFFEVPEDRRDPSSRRIRLGYVRFPSTSPNPGPPIVYLAGGPGGAGTDAAAGVRFPLFMALREVADVIAFDQRGTGLSAHIPARPAPAQPWPAFTRASLTPWIRDQVQQAWTQWKQAGVDLSAYNTEQNADDVEDLRRHLGAEKISLWGISYGTHLALSILKRHGDRVDRVALASLEGQDQTVKRPSRIDDYLRQVDALIGADPTSRAAVPDLCLLMRRVHERLEADPITVTLGEGAGGASLRVGGFGLQTVAAGMIANPNTLATLPGLYLALDAGLIDLVAPAFSGLPGLLSVSGMPEAMDMASGVSASRLAIIRREAGSAVLGDALNYPMPHLVGAIRGVDLGQAFRAPISTDTTALLISGSLDGRTPLAEQAEVATQFTRRSEVLVENAGHNVYESHPEISRLLVRFFQGETPPDTHLHLPAPAFIVG